MAGEYEQESTRARLAQHDQTQADSLHEYQQAQHERIANRGMTTPLESFQEYKARLAQEQAVRETMIGPPLGGGIVQMLRAPGKMFARSDILAILRARLAAGSGVGPDGLHAAAVFEIQYLIKTFENLE